MEGTVVVVPHPQLQLIRKKFPQKRVCPYKSWSVSSSREEAQYSRRRRKKQMEMMFLPSLNPRKKSTFNVRVLRPSGTSKPRRELQEKKELQENFFSFLFVVPHIEKR